MFSYTRDVHDAGCDDEEIVDSGSPNNFIGGSHTATPLSTLTISHWKYSVESGKMAIGYSFSAKNIYDTKITFAGKVQDGGTSEVHSGSFNSPLITDTSRTLPVHAHAMMKPFK